MQSITLNFHRDELYRRLRGVIEDPPREDEDEQSVHIIPVIIYKWG